ncbi:calcium-dependent protein kinase [Plakobranchus ocellatus]|uniref:Calcium-dependent protein kinase n=1 Tax=Plakobranchus ocellatus TaxID=259542 RepID=A0AAV3ZXY7_9GAST|nr:calcium-dependent protein kinase [Plakobranchus ocellatus]
MDPEVKAMIDEFAFDFDQADKDKSGALTLPEVVDVLKTVGFKGSDEEAKEIFSHLDRNADNKITRDEFKDAMIRLPRMTTKEFMLRKTFMQLDRDKSGYLVRSELMNALKRGRMGIRIPPDQIAAIEASLSEDKDGRIAYEEFLERLGVEESASFLKQIFGMLDKDKSGYLSREEIIKALESEGELQRLIPRLLPLLERLDTRDRDQKISYSEFVEEWIKEDAKTSGR